MRRGISAVLLLAASAATVGQTAPSSRIEAVLAAAREQVGVTVIYDGSYARIGYPGGDVAEERGVCTDVLVRAFRRVGIDLQVLVHEDMTRDFGAYPHLWGLTRPDSAIDHRRVQNLKVFFERHGKSLPVTATPGDYLPGDIVTWRLPSGQGHIGLVSSRSTPGGQRPLVLHNIGRGAQEEDLLFLYPITGHYRYL